MSKLCNKKKMGEYKMLKCVRGAGHEGYCSFVPYGESHWKRAERLRRQNAVKPEGEKDDE